MTPRQDIINAFAKRDKNAPALPNTAKAALPGG